MQLTKPGRPSRGAGSSGWVSRRLWERPHHHHEVERELELADDLATLSLVFMWFVFGAVVSLIFVTPVQRPWILFALLALTVLGMLLMHLAFLGSVVPHGLFGANGLPRGDFTNHQLEAPEITKFKRHKLPILT